MTTDTTTTTGLRLVRLSDAYLTGNAAQSPARGMRDHYNPDNPDSAVYYAGPSEYGSDWVCIVLAESDPRHAGAWLLLPGQHGLPEDAVGTFYGWHVQGVSAGVVTPYDATAVEAVEDVPSSEPEAPVTYTADDVEAARREGRAAAEREFQAWKDRATQVAHQYADDNSLCGEFDRCMEEIGLPTRVRERTFYVTVRVAVDVEAALDEAPERDAVIEAVRNVHLSHYSGDWTVEDGDGDEVDSW
jgi:hypothetical protein